MFTDKKHVEVYRKRAMYISKTCGSKTEAILAKLDTDVQIWHVKKLVYTVEFTHKYFCQINNSLKPTILD